MTAHGGEAVALLAAVVWGASDFCGGLVTRRASSAVIVTLAHGVGLAVLLALQLSLHASAPDIYTIRYGLLAGLGGGLGLLALYAALSLGSMGLVAAVSGVVTSIVPVIVSFFLEGKPSALQLAGFALAAVAIWLIAYSPTKKSPPDQSPAHPRGLGLAVLAGIGFGVLLLFLHMAGKTSVMWALTFSRVGSFSCAVAAWAVMTLRTRTTSKESAGAQPGTSPSNTSPSGWMPFLTKVVPLAFAAGVLDTSGNLFYTYSSLAGRLDVAAVLSSLYPAGTILLAMVILRERATRSQTAGMALALVAVALISA